MHVESGRDRYLEVAIEKATSKESDTVNQTALRTIKALCKSDPGQSAAAAELLIERFKDEHAQVGRTILWERLFWHFCECRMGVISHIRGCRLKSGFLLTASSEWDCRSEFTPSMLRRCCFRGASPFGQLLPGTSQSSWNRLWGSGLTNRCQGRSPWLISCANKLLRLLSSGMKSGGACTTR